MLKKRGKGINPSKEGINTSKGGINPSKGGKGD